MSNFDFNRTCRTCLTQTSSLKNIYTDQQILNKQTTLSDMIMLCSSVLIEKHDGLPSHICLDCFDNLNRAFLFRKQCERSDFTLKNNAPSLKIKDDDSVLTGNDVPLVSAIFKSEATLENNEQYALFDCSFPESNPESKTDDEKPFKVVQPEKKRKEYKCEECKEICLGLASYWKHMEKIHGKLYKCTDCNKEYKTRYLLNQHRSAKHVTQSEIDGKGLPKTCEICNKTFRFHSNLLRHKLIHTGEKPYLCNVCGKGFGQLSYLKIHSFIHTGEKPYKCEMCDKSFAAPGTLMTHQRIHTGERPHACNICGKDFPQSGYLRAHIRTHTGEKPVECKVCHRRFNQSGRLIIHMRIHSGEKPYNCSECGRSFAVKGTLKKHMRTHTGERPYVCSVCGQAFAQSGTLATHMKVHKPKP